MEVALKVIDGKNAGREIKVPIKRFLIGRADDCHLRPKSEAISRNHCAILVNDDDDEVVVRDLNSRNGTFVNGERISGDRPLDTGDQLMIGRLEFEVIIRGRKQAPARMQTLSGPDSSGSLDFDITSWLEEANASERAQRQSDPDTRQFRLDETDRLALEKADTERAGDEKTDESSVKKPVRPEKKEVGKLPTRPNQGTANSKEAAAEMLKKFFNNR